MAISFLAKSKKLFFPLEKSSFSNSRKSGILSWESIKEKLREKERERLASQPFKIDEVDSVLSMGDVYQKQQEDKLLTEAELAGTEIQETEELEEEQVLDNIAEVKFY